MKTHAVGDFGVENVKFQTLTTALKLRKTHLQSTSKKNGQGMTSTKKTLLASAFNAQNGLLIVKSKSIPLSLSMDMSQRGFHKDKSSSNLDDRYLVAGMGGGVRGGEGRGGERYLCIISREDMPRYVHRWVRVFGHYGDERRMFKRVYKFVQEAL
jgi:hypothetical protein